MAADLVSEIDSSSQEYKSSVKELGKEQRKDQLSKIQELFQKAREYSDDKVQIAMQMYEMVGAYGMLVWYTYCIAHHIKLS